MTKLTLIDGCLPAGTECPVPQCPCTAGGRHAGKDHKVPFSCALLRGWATTKEGRQVVSYPGMTDHDDEESRLDRDAARHAYNSQFEET